MAFSAGTLSFAATGVPFEIPGALHGKAQLDTASPVICGTVSLIRLLRSGSLVSVHFPG
jgi:hypothetical protein